MPFKPGGTFTLLFFFFPTSQDGVVEILPLLLHRAQRGVNVRFRGFHPFSLSLSFSPRQSILTCNVLPSSCATLSTRARARSRQPAIMTSDSSDDDRPLARPNGHRKSTHTRFHLRGSKNFCLDPLHQNKRPAPPGRLASRHLTLVRAMIANTTHLSH